MMMVIKQITGLTLRICENDVANMSIFLLAILFLKRLFEKKNVYGIVRE
jgi:hypothetical protein